MSQWPYHMLQKVFSFLILNRTKEIKKKSSGTRVQLTKRRLLSEIHCLFLLLLKISSVLTYCNSAQRKTKEQATK